MSDTLRDTVGVDSARGLGACALPLSDPAQMSPGVACLVFREPREHLRISDSLSGTGMQHVPKLSKLGQWLLEVNANEGTSFTGPAVTLTWEQQ